MCLSVRKISFRSLGFAHGITSHAIIQKQQSCHMVGGQGCSLCLELAPHEAVTHAPLSRTIPTPPFHRPLFFPVQAHKMLSELGAVWEPEGGITI